jgi:hypothetical protein
MIKSLERRKPNGQNMITKMVYGHLSFHIFLMSYAGRRGRDHIVVGGDLP